MPAPESLGRCVLVAGASGRTGHLTVAAAQRTGPGARPGAPIHRGRAAVVGIIDAARAAGTAHVVLLTSRGMGRSAAAVQPAFRTARGPILAAMAEAEELWWPFSASVRRNKLKCLTDTLNGQHNPLRTAQHLQRAYATIREFAWRR